MSDPIIKYREYKGITVGDVNDIITYVNGMSSSPIGTYVVDVGKQGDVYYALNSNGEQITWTTGGGGSSIDTYVESIQPHDYSITYMFYDQGVLNQNEIYFASINGTSVIGKNEISVQTPITSDTDIQVNNIEVANKVKFGNYFIDRPSLANLLHTVQVDLPDAIDSKEDKLPTYVNDKYLKVVNGSLSWEDAGGEGGSKYYLHTVSFNTLTSPEIHFQVGVISKNSATYANFDAFWNDRKKIVSLFGTPNMISNALYFNGAIADQFSIKARGVILDEGQFSTDVIDIGYSDVDYSSFGDYGVEEL